MNWQKLRHATLEEIIAWAEPQSWCQEMANCAQDAQWHSEGDVWTHTKMVCRELAALDQWSSLSGSDRTKLIFTALFHDAAKPMTSQVDPETGRIRSPNHAIKGQQLVRNLLREIGCDLAVREDISRLVRFHGRPAFLTEKERPVDEVIKLSWLVNNRLLYLFALADTRGRDTDSMNRPEENLHYWKLVAEENGCYVRPFAFANDQARFLFYRRREPDRDYVPYEDYRCDVTMMSGLPGSGKDTWLASHGSELPVVSLDDIRGELGVAPTDNQGTVAQVARERCREHLRAKRSFAFNATNLIRQTRARWIDLFADYGAKINLVYVEPPLKQILKQNRQRTNAVPDAVIKKMASRCEPPTMSECHTLVMTE